MPKPWIRLYRSALTNPKVGRLTLEERGFWVSLLMLSDDDGRLPSEADLAWLIRVDEGEVIRHVASLQRHGLVTRDGHSLSLHDWSEHQFNSDADPTAADRKRRQREREKAQKSAVTRDSHGSHGPRHASVTRTDTDTDTDKTLTSFVPTQRVVPDAPKAKRGTSLPPDFVIPYPWITDAMRLREQQGKGPIPYGAEADRFVNHFVANGKAMKDWRRAWLNWCTSPFVDKLNAGGQNGKPIDKRNRAGETLGALFEGIATDRDRGDV